MDDYTFIATVLHLLDENQGFIQRYPNERRDRLIHLRNMCVIFIELMNQQLDNLNEITAEGEIVSSFIFSLVNDENELRFDHLFLSLMRNAEQRDARAGLF